MGLIISRFRRKKSKDETLAALDSKIRSIEQYGRNTEQRRRKVVGNVVIISVGIYILGIIFSYFYCRPTSWKDGLLYSVPILVSPMFIILLRNITTKYYDWKLRRNRVKLSGLRTEKKKILEEIMDKETYKVAKDLLEKYGNTEMEKPMQLVRRTSPPLSAPVTPAKTSSISTLIAATPGQLQYRHSGSSGPLGRQMPLTPQRFMPAPIMATPNQITPLMADKLPRPIKTASGGGAFDRLVDYLIGDGPSNRYALICSSCKSHNGMALSEEFEYLSYKCAYCRQLNPSRKTRPKPPALLSTPINTDTSDHKSSSENSDLDDTPEKLTQSGCSDPAFNSTSLSHPSPSSVSTCDENETEMSHVSPSDDSHMSVDEPRISVDEPAENPTEPDAKSDTDKKED